MKKIIVLLATTAFSFSALAQIQVQVKESDLPAEFKREPSYIQNRICGELMASLARMSAGLYAANPNKPKLREAAITTGTRAMVFVKANAPLTDEERVRARKVAEQIEKSGSAKSPVVLAYAFCEQRAKRWLDEGVVTPEDYRVTEIEVRKALEASEKPKKP